PAGDRGLPGVELLDLPQAGDTGDDPGSAHRAAGDPARAMTSTLQRSKGLDPWVLEARRTASTTAARPRRLGPVRHRAVVTLRGLGLVLVADALARGIAGLAAGGFPGGTVHLVLLGAVGALLRAGAEWATAVVARRMATAVKRDLRGRLWRRMVLGDTGGGST